MIKDIIIYFSMTFYIQLKYKTVKLNMDLKSKINVEILIIIKSSI